MVAGTEPDLAERTGRDESPWLHHREVVAPVNLGQGRWARLLACVGGSRFAGEVDEWLTADVDQDLFD